MIEIYLALLLAQARPAEPPKPKPALEVNELIRKIAQSGQVVEIAVKPETRLKPAAPIAPGQPPVLRFRGIEGQLRHRFGDLDLVVDDAGH
jgi:hypothetical protein